MLLYEMGLQYYGCVITPSKTYLGKKIDMKKVEKFIKVMSKIKDREELSKVLAKLVR